MSRLRLFFATVALATLVTACAKSDSGIVMPGEQGEITTVTYCGTLRMDIHGQSPGASPKAAILYVHGGGWESGGRGDGFEQRRIRPLSDSGFIVATLDYRLAPDNVHPAQVHDVKCAIRYLRAHANELGIDPLRIGVMGDSAGGHLAALAGLAGPEDGLEGPGFPGVSSEVKAVATFYGIFDLVNVEPSLAEIAVPRAFPTHAARVNASPVLYVDGNDPPFLIMHGREDRFIDIAQSVKLSIILTDAGHSPLLVVVENADHGFVASGGPPTPDNGQLDQLLVAFFREHLM